jgi:hypothetical protein
MLQNADGQFQTDKKTPDTKLNNKDNTTTSTASDKIVVSTTRRTNFK